MPLTPNSFPWMSALRDLPRASSMKYSELSFTSSASNLLHPARLVQGWVHRPPSCANHWDCPPSVTIPVTARQVHPWLFLKFIQTCAEDTAARGCWRCRPGSPRRACVSRLHFRPACIPRFSQVSAASPSCDAGR